MTAERTISRATRALRFLFARLWIGVLVLVAAGGGWLLKGGLSPAVPDAGGPAGHAHETADTRAPELWTCAMHPQIRMPDPGLCPICGMELVPISGGAAGGEEESMRRLTVRPAARALMRIQTSPVERRFVETEVRMTGKIAYDETRLADLTAWVPGRIDRLWVDFTGIEVSKGDHMVYLYSPKLYADQTALLESLGRVKRLQDGHQDALADKAFAALDAARERLRQLGLTQTQIDEIEASGIPSDHHTIYAPMGGVVVHRNGQAGMYVQEGTRIYTIADLSRLWVQLDAYESDLVWLHYGQDVDFTTEAYPGEVFTGTIAFLSPELDPLTRTVKVRVNLDNSSGKLKPQMFVRAIVRTAVAAGGLVMDPDLAGKWICPMHPEVVGDEPGACSVCEMDLVTTESRGYVALPESAAERPLVIPASAPLVTGTRAIVYVELPDTDEPTFEGREIVLGPRAGEWYLVRSGLQEGERVVTSGSFKIDSELQIRARPSMMTPEGGARGGHRHGAPQTGAEHQPSEGTMQAPPGARRGLEEIERAWIEIGRAHDTGDLSAVRDAFGILHRAVRHVDRELFVDKARAVWTELSMHLSNDAVEGGALERLGDADRLIEILERDIGRLRSAFGSFAPGAETARFEVSSAFRAQLTAFWRSYLEIHAALSSDRVDAVPKAAARASAALGAIDMGSVGTGAAHSAWMEAADALGAALAPLLEGDDIEAMRESFEALSRATTTVVRLFGVDDEAFEIECRMAFGRGARWLQASEEVLNPYYGDEMLRCGDVVDRIAARDDGDE